jgi:hypothetical protein
MCCSSQLAANSQLSSEILCPVHSKDPFFASSGQPGNMLFVAMGGDTIASKMQSRADDRHPPIDALNQSVAMALTSTISTTTFAGGMVTRTREDRGLVNFGLPGTTLMMPTVAYSSGRYVKMVVMN